MFYIDLRDINHAFDLDTIWTVRHAKLNEISHYPRRYRVLSTRIEIDSMLLNTEKRIDERLRETKVERKKKKKKPFLQSGASPSPPHLFFTDRLERGAASARPLTRSVGGRKRSRWGERGGREARKRDRQVGPREEPAAAMVTVAFPPRLVAMEMAAPFPSALLSSPLFSFSRFLCSTRMPADTLTLAKFRPPRSRTPIFSPTTRGDSLSRARFVLPSRRVPLLHEEREVEREEQTEETARGHVRMRDTWSFAISRLDATPERFDHLSNASHSQPRNALSRDAYLWRSRGSWCLSKKVDTMSLTTAHAWKNRSLILRNLTSEILYRIFL